MTNPEPYTIQTAKNHRDAYLNAISTINDTEREAIEQYVTELTSFISEPTDDCRFDRNGHCQEHWDFDIDPETKPQCWTKELATLLGKR